MTDITIDPADARRLLVERRMRAAARKRAAEERIQPRPAELAELPTSFAQSRLWFLDQWNPGRAAYSIPFAFRIRGGLDVPALRAALSEIVARHEVLRTTFASVDGVPLQVVGAPAALSLPVTDLSGLPGPERDREAARRARDGAALAFDLAAGPLLRSELLRLADEEHLLLLTLHHIVSDAWSFRILFAELDALYTAFAEGAPSPLAPLALQYGDYAVWERQRSRSDSLTRHLEYWTQRLADLPVVEFPTDRPRPAVLSGAGSRIRLTWDEELAERAAHCARVNGATVHMLLVAALAGLLHVHSGPGDQVFGAAVAGRTRTQTEDLIGFFVNTLVMRIETGDDPRLDELVHRARGAVIEGSSHQALPFDRLVEELRIPRELNRNPLFQIMISTQGAGQAPAAALRDLSVAVEPVDLDIAKFDLTFIFTEASDHLGVEIEYSTDLFDESTVRLLADRFERMLRAIVTRPRERLGSVDVLGGEERRHLLELSAAEPAPWPREPVTAAFARWARTTPDRPAASFDGRTLTYAELDAWANRLAHRLVSQGIGSGSRVGLCTPRSVELVVGMLAIARTGAAYVPLDPANPAERLAYMLDDAEVQAVLVEPSVAHVLPRGSYAAVPLDAAEEQPAVEPQVRIDPDDMLYVIYTSGSTGRPKGVCISHRAVMGLVWEADFVRLGADDVLGQASNASFDVATFEVWGALCNGAHVVGVPKEVLLSGPALREHIATHGVSVMNVPSSLLGVLVRETPDVFAGLRTLLFGGEAADPAAVASVLRHPPGRMLNVYGPSETTTFSVAGPVTEVAADDTSVPLGRPVSHMWVYVMDGEGRLAPPGAEGEIWIGGIGLASGYWGRPDLTAERFVEDPFRPGERVYRSGDLGRWRADGVLEFCGRVDDQVKIRGYRIEPGEIAGVLTEHPAVHEAAVIAHRDGPDAIRLLAYVVPSGTRELDAAAVRRFAAERLPEFMVPAAVVLMDRLPLNANDKVDKAALPVPAAGEAVASEEFVAPRTATEEALAEIWCEVLGCARAGIHDDFFALGGHSLLVTQVVSRLESRLGVRVPLRAVFEAPVLERLAQVVDGLGSKAAGGAVVPAIVPVPRGGTLPVSFAQQRLWFLDRLVPDSAFYNMPDGFRVRGPLDVEALQSAVDTVVARHEALRTTFTELEGTPRQLIHPTSRVPVRVVEAAGEEQARVITAAEVQEPFDLERGPLLRVLVVRLSRDESLLLLTLHHIVSDGWSAGVLWAELATAYDAAVAGVAHGLPDLSLQYADFAAWQRDWLRGEVLETQRTYWTRALDGLVPLELPGDRPRPPVQSHHGAALEFSVAPTTADALRRMAREGHATLFMCLFGAFAAVLSRLSGQTDVALGYPIANRNHGDTEKIIGFFVNTLVLRTDLSGDPTFTDIVERVREVALNGYAHQDLPFEDLVEQLKPERDLSRNPLVQITFQLLNEADPSVVLNGCEVTRFERGELTNRFDVAMDMVDESDRLWGWINYSTDLYDASTVQRLIDRFLRVLDAVATDPTLRLTDLPLIDDHERHQLLDTFTPTPLPTGPQRAHQLFEEHARLTPHAPALVHADTTWTYEELNKTANRLAHHLTTHGAGPDTRIALCTRRDTTTVATILAIWKTGAAYIPLDPHHPDTRLHHLINDSNPHLLLTDHTTHHRLTPHHNHPTLNLDEPWGNHPDHNPDLPGTPHDLAYVIYTSGSTGTPKGVQIEHRSVSRLAAALQESFGVSAPSRSGAQLRVAHTAPFSFDASVEQLSWMLSGHELHLVPDSVRRDPEALVAHVRSYALDVMDSTASQLELLMSLGLFAGRDDAGRGPGPRLVMVGGEAVGPALWSAMRETAGTRFFNLYGPTECTVDATVQPLESADERPAIGRPLPGTHVYVMDPNGRLAPTGVTGELWIGGTGVARGYWGRPDLTAERFVEDPFRPGERVYRSGDLGRWRADGVLEFCGRVDDQVKIRGYRIEPGEIAAVLTEHPAVREAAVIAHRQNGLPARLVAYVVPSGEGELDGAAVRRFAAERLPEFMVPAAVVLMDRLPLNANDKLDRAALPVPTADDAGPDEAYVAPRTATEETLAEIWCEVLGCARAGIHDDFFALGGHSLLVTQVVSRLESRLGIRIPLRTVFEAPVLERLAEAVDAYTGEGSPGDDDAARRIVRVERGTPLPLSFAQQRLWFLDRLVPDSAFYNMPDGYRIRGPLDVQALQSAVDTVVARHEALRTTFTELEGTPRQLIHPSLRVLVRVVEAAGEEQARHEAVAETQQPFDLERGPLLRVTVVRLPGEESLLLMTMHHIVSDGWSSGVFLSELSAAYSAAVRGEAVVLPELTVQYPDFAAWQRDWLRGEVLETQRTYWTRALDGLVPLELPGDRPRPPVQSHHGAALEFSVAPTTADALRRMAREGHATLFMCLFGAFAAVLSRLSGQTDVALGYPIANRNHGDTEKIIGFFVNTLVLRTDLSGDPTFTDIVERVREVALNGYAHQDLPFEDLVEQLKPERDLSRNPLVQITFQLLNEADPSVVLNGCEVTRFERGELTNRFDVAMDMVDESDRLWGWINYSTDLYDASTVQRLIDRFLRVLDAVATDPTLRLTDLPLIDDHERHQLLDTFTPTPLPTGPQRAHQLFEEHARLTPHAPALVHADTTWTYEELNKTANRLAHHLTTHGAGPDTRIALCTRRDTTTVATILAIWKTGAAYIPLDPHHPDTRLHHLINDSDPHLLLTDHTTHHRFTPHHNHPTLNLDEPWGNHPDHNPDLPGTPHDLAYVIYTSGSTGTPKGVQIEHRSLACFFGAERPRLSAPADGGPVRAAHMAPFSFDASVDQLAWMMAGGHELHLVPDEVRRDTHALAAFVREHRIDILSVTPSQLELLMGIGLFSATGDEGQGSAPRLVMVGGEAIGPALWSAMRETAGTRFFNLYGPTECTVEVTIHALDTADERPAIGRPLPGTHVYVMDPNGRLAPIGVTGELWIGGTGVARGYWGRPDLTAERFVEDPFRPGERVYRTGDLGRWRADGILEFHGRLDDQVKIRGYRIEPGEIAAVLTEHPAVREAAVIAHRQNDLPARLLAYVVPSDAPEGESVAPDSGADSGARDEAARDRVEKWRSVFQTTHAEANDRSSDFDISGWTSSLTGDELPGEEMRDWVEETVSRIRALRPRRVLEIGVGTGLLLWRLAPDCERYVGTDFSATTLDGLRSRLERRPVDGVELMHREATDLSGFGPDEFDCVIVNSVVQYFPDDAYLRKALSAALGVLRPGGRLFVGDVRHLGLLDSFHLDVAAARTGGGSRKLLHQEFLRRGEQEKELVLSPAWFEEFASAHGLAGVSASPKAGAYDNELTRYRYDVVLSAEPAGVPAGAGPDTWRDCSERPVTAEEVRELLGREGRLLLSRVPNALVRDSARRAARLLGEDTAAAAPGALSVTDLAAVAAEYGLPVAFSWRACHPEGAFDAAIGPDAGPGLFPAPRSVPEGPRANAPGARDRAADLGVVLREELARVLPEYLVPDAVISVPALPLTVNGKLKTDALPLPGVAAGAVAPRTPAEHLFAGLWSEVLKLTGIGVHDNFFDLGGNSLVATRVIAGAARAGVHITLKDLFQNQTIEELATLCGPAGPGEDH